MWLNLIAHSKPNLQPLFLLGFSLLLNIVLQFPSVEAKFNDTLEASAHPRQELVCGETASFERSSPSHSWVIGSTLVAVSSAASQVSSALVPLKLHIFSSAQTTRKTLLSVVVFMNQRILYRISGLAPPLV